VSRHTLAPGDASDGQDQSQAVNLESVLVIPRDPLVDSSIGESSSSDRFHHAMHEDPPATNVVIPFLSTCVHLDGSLQLLIIWSPFFFANLVDNGTTATGHTPASSTTPPPHVPDAHRHFDKQQDNSVNDTIDHDERIGLTRVNQTDLSVPPPRPPSLPPSIDPSFALGHSEETRAADRTEKEEAEGSGMNEGNIRPELSIRGESLVASLWWSVFGGPFPSSLSQASSSSSSSILVLYSLGLGSGGHLPGWVVASSDDAAATAVEG
jgi:hypothetical protein